MRPLPLSLSILLLAAAVLPAQDVVSGPEKGAAVPALSVHDATGLHKDKTVDYAAERRDKPTVYLFVRSDRFDRPMNRFMKTLDTQVKKDYPDVYVVAVWVTEDVDKTKEYLPRVQQSVQYQATALTVGGDKEGPKGWNVNTDAHLTVVVATKGKVTATFAYRSVNETDVPKVAEAVKMAAGGK
jgi:hypothetical protein